MELFQQLWQKQNVEKYSTWLDSCTLAIDVKHKFFSFKVYRIYTMDATDFRNC